LKRLVCIVSTLYVAALTFSAPAVAADDVPTYHDQKMTFDVFAGGVHAVKANMEMDFSKEGRYSISFGAETRGLLGSLVPWAGTFASKGWAMRDGRRIPEMHESTATWQGEHEIKTYRYTKKGGFQDLVTTFKGKKPKTTIPDVELTKGTTDALTATILVMEKVSDGGNCEGTSEVFDGKRRFNLIYRHQQVVMLKKTRYNAYEGPAIECTVEVEPISGKWYKKPRGWLSIQEQGRERGTMPTVWLAQVVPNAVVVPVRVRVKTAYGTLFMHMKSYESGDTTLKSEK